MFVRLETV